PADFYCGQTDARCEYSIYGSFAEAARQTTDDPSADDMLQNAVRHIEASGYREMANHHPGKPQRSKIGGTSAIERSKLAHHAQCLDDHEDHVERRRRHQSREHGYTPCRSRNDAVCFGIERLNQKSFGQPDAIGWLHDVILMLTQ